MCQLRGDKWSAEWRPGRSNPECGEEGGGGGGGWGFKPLCKGGHDGPASDNESGQTEFYTVSQTQRQCVNQTS